MKATVKALLVRDRRVLLLRRSASAAVLPDTWDLPGGRLEAGESLLQALAREAQEEAGLTLRAECVLYATVFSPDPARQVLLLAYLCGDGEAQTVRLSAEHSAFTWATASQARALLPAVILSDWDTYHVWETLALDA